MRLKRTHAVLALSALVALAQFRESGDPKLSAHLTLETEPRMPVRVYLFKDDKPFRLSPVDAMLPLRVDLLYRERLWTRSPDPATLEVTCNDQSHFFLLKGRADYELPQGKYRVEAYRGLFYRPVSIDFELIAGQNKRIALPMANWLGAEANEWLSGDDHIHLVRAKGDDPVYLKWLQAEDLSVANFLQLQRQMDAAVQYGFGPDAEAKSHGHSIRSGHESRSEFFGHVNLLGGHTMIRPLSVGSMYANEPEVFPYPAILFRQGRKVGALTGYAHFDGSMRHSTLLMDLSLNHLDFIEVFQFGQLQDERWYELLNAGFHIKGLAGSDFPANYGRRGWQGRYISLLGPERALVRAKPARLSAYEAWADGVREGEVIVTNGPVVRVQMSGRTAEASAQFFRPLIQLEIVADGKVIASVPGNGKSTRLVASVEVPASAVWVAARVSAEKVGDEPLIRAHTNPHFLRDEAVPGGRKVLADRWEKELEFYRTLGSDLLAGEKREMFFREAEEALRKLRN